MIVGIDEAGRGPVIGPLVICALGVEDEEDIAFVKKDSKKLTPKKRNEYSKRIEIIAKCSLVEVWPEEIDRLRETISINEIELQRMAQAVLRLGRADRIYVDSCDTNEERFGKNLKSYLAYDCQIVSRHGADETFPIVAAASIIAKVRRDALVSEIRKKVGKDFGSGYPSDKKTIEFLREWHSEHENPPEFVRKSWKTKIDSNTHPKESHMRAMPW